MGTGEKIAGVLALFVSAPLWYWLLYQVLARVQATELMWFLYWVYVPVGLLGQLITKLTAKEVK